MGTSLFPFEELQDVLILAEKGKLEQPNAVIKIADDSEEASNLLA